LPNLEGHSRSRILEGTLPQLFRFGRLPDEFQQASSAFSCSTGRHKASSPFNLKGVLAATTRATGSVAEQSTCRAGPPQVIARPLQSQSPLAASTPSTRLRKQRRGDWSAQSPCDGSAFSSRSGTFSLVSICRTSPCVNCVAKNQGRPRQATPGRASGAEAFRRIHRMQRRFLTRHRRQRHTTTTWIAERRRSLSRRLRVSLVGRPARECIENAQYAARRESWQCPRWRRHTAVGAPLAMLE